MTVNPLAAKVATPYARALFDFSIEQNNMHQITADFQNLQTLLSRTDELTNYLNNPLINAKAKRDILIKILKPQINQETLKFLIILVNRNRINILESIMDQYLKFVYELASIKMIEVSTAFAFTNKQKNTLIKKLKELTDAREIRLVITVNPNLIGGFLIKTDSKVIDLTIKNQLQRLANHLDSVLEI